jgi:hypothetical protein
MFMRLAIGITVILLSAQEMLKLSAHDEGSRTMQFFCQEPLREIATPKASAATSSGTLALSRIGCEDEQREHTTVDFTSPDTQQTTQQPVVVSNENDAFSHGSFVVAPSSYS